MHPACLEELNNEEFKAFLDSFDYVLSDCDGVLWTRTPLPGADLFLKFLRKHGKKIHFVSNNSIRSQKNYEAMFKSVGIEHSVENLTIPSTAIVEFLKSINFDKQVYSISCAETNRVLAANGFKYKDGPDVGADNYQDYLKYLADDPDIGAVVIDSDFKVNLPKIYKAITYLKRPEVLFINGATDKYVPLKPGQLSLGPGLFTDFIEEETKRKPVQLGKPGKDFGEYAMKRAGVTDASRVLFIGDMIEQDIGLGKSVGFKTLLVLTSVSKDTMFDHNIKPDYYANSLGSIVSQFQV